MLYFASLHLVLIPGITTKLGIIERDSLFEMTKFDIIVSFQLHKRKNHVMSRKVPANGFSNQRAQCCR